MKKLFYALLLVVLFGCGSSAPKQVNDAGNAQIEATNGVAVSQGLYDELFRIIDLNDAGKMPDSEFKPLAEALKKKIDANDALLTIDQKAIVKAYGQQLLDKLIEKKMARTN